jgi:hypothetical protein
MEPLLSTLVRDLAHGTGASALPDAPVVPHTPRRATILRRQAGAALHGLARRIEPREAHRVEDACYGTA